MSGTRATPPSVHVCDCNRSFTVDAACLPAGAQCHHALCGAESAALEAALAEGGEVHVACTQETALFGELPSMTIRSTHGN